MPRHSARIIWTAFILLTVELAPAHASPDSDYTLGVQYYNQRQYKAAADILWKSITDGNPNASPWLYMAHAYYSMGKTGQAIKHYRSIVSTFPGTPEAAAAAQYLKRLDPHGTYAVDAPAPVTASTKPRNPSNPSFQKTDDFDRLPDQGKVYFERRGAHVFVSADLNGRATSMMFDTGAPFTSMSADTFEACGGQLGDRKPDSTVGGVGAERFPAWRCTATVKVGEITRTNLPVIVTSYSKADTLLGQNFFSPYQYTIDDQNSTIMFTKMGSGKSSAAVGSASLSVPFKWKGQYMMVDAKFNGKPYPCIFDTGAFSIALSRKQLREIGIPIPGNAVSSKSSGYGGTTDTLVFEIDSISLGPITKKNIEIHVLENTIMSAPLLGQPLFSDYLFTIDNDHKMIQFVKR